MATSYGKILEAILSAMKADTGITALLASKTIGGVASQANNIFYGGPISGMTLPCIAMRDMGPYPVDAQQHEYPMSNCRVMLEISIFGVSQDCRPIQSELDRFFEAQNASVAIDTTSWLFQDFDTSAGWTNVGVPKVIYQAAENLEQRVKVFGIECADKGVIGS